MSHAIRTVAAIVTLACSTIAAAAHPASAQSIAEALRNLSGRYVSSSAERWGEAYGHREFVFDDGRWSLRFTLSLDPARRQPVFEFRTQGPYAVLRPSAKVAGAWDAVFTEERKWVTLRTADPALAAAFGLADCGLAVDVEKDISITGCSQWKPVADGAEDHDLLALDADGGLRFGVRPADNHMCTPDRRPSALLPAVRRQP